MGLYILNIKLKNYTKSIVKLISIITVAFFLILAFILFKYKPAYKVSILGEDVGYISNKNEFEQLVNSEILNTQKENIAYVDIEALPEYKLVLLDNKQETSEEEIFNKVQDMAVITYKMYEITLEKGSTTYVSSKQEAEEIVNSIKANQEDAEITMQEIYTNDLNELEGKVEVASSVQTKLQAEYEEIESSTFNGVYFSVKPVTGNITSRFGAIESIRDHAHKGMDIAAPNGTPIKAAAEGTIKYAGWMGGYGNLVIISHGNGVETYYGHCSKIYVKKGQEVTAGDTIAAVGSTGYSTGNHLHFEIRKDGTQVNPQKYVYK